jgi:hypothetical protein
VLDIRRIDWLLCSGRQKDFYGVVVQRAFAGTTPGIRVQITEWVYDEYGNLCRKIYAD